MALFLVLSSLLLHASAISAKLYQNPEYPSNPYIITPVAAPIGRDGRVIDTPEVARAKAAHLAAFSRLSTTTGQRPTTAASLAAGARSGPGFFSSSVRHRPYGYRGPSAPLAHDGQVLDTPEVARAKAAHFAVFNQAASRPRYDDAPAPLKTYSIEDTENNENNDDEDDDEYRPGSYSTSEDVDDDDDDSAETRGYDDNDDNDDGPQYQGPAAPLAEDGRVVDTPEVARAKAAHLAAVQRASTSGRYQKPRSGYYEGY